MAPPQVTGTSQLLDLPPELRNAIYTYVLSSTKPIDFGATTTATHTALLRTCKQVHAEATNIFYAENSFAITVTAENTWPIVEQPQREAAKKYGLVPKVFVKFQTSGESFGHWQDLPNGLVRYMNFSREEGVKHYRLGHDLATALVAAGFRVAAIDCSSPSLDEWSLPRFRVAGFRSRDTSRDEWSVSSVWRDGIDVALAELGGKMRRLAMSDLEIGGESFPG